jgi:hypothetical protein
MMTERENGRASATGSSYLIKRLFSPRLETHPAVDRVVVIS